jgi:hypothetical protein
MKPGGALEAIAEASARTGIRCVFRGSAMRLGKSSLAPANKAAKLHSHHIENIGDVRLPKAAI